MLFPRYSSRMIDYPTRLRKAQARMIDLGVDLMFLPYSASLHYLMGVAREEQNFGNTIYPGDWMTGAWIAADCAPILTLPRMQAAFHGTHTQHAVRVLPDAGDPLALVQDVLAALRISGKARVAIEDRARAETVLNIQALLPGMALTCASDILQPLRMLKDAAEIEVLRKAGAITEAAYEATLSRIKPGMTNLDLITEVNYQLLKAGSFAPSFQTSFYNMGPGFPFAFGNAADVMLVPLSPPVAICFDFGAVLDGYCYDFGRAVHFGEPGAEYRRAYDLVIASQAAGIAALKAGNTCEQADAAARAVIVDGGYGEGFRHRLGHGIGMDVHEPPFLTAGSSTVMEPGMCFTVEPSITLPHVFSARVEDVVVVGETGGMALTARFKELRVYA